MKLLRMQPTFTVSVPLGADELMRQFRQVIASPEFRGRAVSAGHCIEFTIDSDERRFWSPHLSVQVLDCQLQSETQLFGRFSPRPEIWTMVMFCYFLAAFGISAAAIYGYVQWILGETPWGFVIIPAGLVTIGSLHLTSLIGQSLSGDQMTLLRERFDRAIELAIDSPISGRAKIDEPTFQ